MALISCKNLCIGYNNKQVVENLTFCVEKSDYLCIVGENGSGKSTLMKTILGLRRPISGELIFSEGLRKNEIGYLPQQTEAQKDFPTSAYEVVLSGTLNSRHPLLPFYTKKQKSAAMGNMELLGIADLKKKCFRELSGGQKQRVLLARALCATTKLILLDEPTTALDPEAADEMYSVIKRLHESGIAVIMISHDTEKAVKYATHILHVAGRPKFFGTVKDYLETDLGKNAIERGRRDA